MKKIFTLAAFALLAVLQVNAQTEVRRTWDFRKGWSSTTIENLYADMEQNGPTVHWRDYEKDATQASKFGDTFWAANTVYTDDNGNALTNVSGEDIIIPELEGLNVKGVKAKGFVIASGYGQSEFADSPNGMYPYGNDFIWLNGSKLVIKIPAALKGDSLRIGVESHKNTEARGINVIVDGVTLTPERGNNKPTVFNEVLYMIPDDTPGVDDYAEVTIKTTSGCHLYYIIVGEGDEPQSTTRNIAYLHSGDATAEPLYSLLLGDENNVMTAISVDNEADKVTKENLSAYDVTVISSSIPADNAVVPALAEIMPWIPVLNVNPSLYGTWGYGKAQSTSATFLYTGAAKNNLFSGEFENFFENDVVPGDYLLGVSNSVGLTAVALHDHFAKDALLGVVATEESMADSSLVLAHAHYPSHNGYIFLPYTNEVLADAMSANDASLIINNALSILRSGKSKITATPAPAFSMEYKDRNTNVTISCPNKNARIFYTIDGSEPTTSSTLYDGVFNLSAETTVKAIAVAEGYLASEVAETVVLMKDQTKLPKVNMEFQDAKTIVTLSSDTPDAILYYNFVGRNDTLASSIYTEPLVLTESREITVHAISDVTVLSEPTTAKIVIKDAKVRVDVAAHMDANPTEYNGGSTSTAYYFSWGKNKGDYPYWDESSDPIYEKDSLGNDVLVGYSKMNVEEVNDFGNGWKVVSRGHVMIWENIKPGNDPGNNSAYNPATAADYSDLVTNYYINIGEWNTAYPRNGVIATTQKIAGPFDVVSFISNGNDAGSPQLVFEVSADSTNWEQLGDTALLATQRLYKKVVRSYEGTNEVYFRTRIAEGNSKAGYYDIYIMKDGEQSAALKAQMDADYKAVISGIENVNASNKVATVLRTEVYSINGTRCNAVSRGLNIVKQLMSDGTVRTQKVVVK